MEDNSRTIKKFVLTFTYLTPWLTKFIYWTILLGGGGEDGGRIIRMDFILTLLCGSGLEDREMRGRWKLIIREQWI